MLLQWWVEVHALWRGYAGVLHGTDDDGAARRCQFPEFSVQREGAARAFDCGRRSTAGDFARSSAGAERRSECDSRSRAERAIDTNGRCGGSGSTTASADETSEWTPERRVAGGGVCGRAGHAISGEA